MSALFSPTTLRQTTFSNRIVVSPMCQYSAVDGNAQDWHLVHLGQLAMSGAGLLILEAAAVEERGRITPGCLGIYSDANEAALAPVLAFCRRHGSAKLGIQLAHAGRKASTHRPWEGRDPLGTDEGAWQTVSSSDLPHHRDWPQPASLSLQELETVKANFVAAVQRSERLGFELIELHAAHGYLLHEFLSPVANQRTDAYGGSLENRMRFPLETFAAMRAAWPRERSMGVRISTTDWLDDGWDEQQSIAFAKALKALECDYICASSGGISEDQKIVLGEGYQAAFASRLRAAADIPTMAVGMLFDPHHAEKLVRDGDADFIALARGLLFDPHWPWSAAAALNATVEAPPQYARAADFRFLREKRAT